MSCLERRREKHLIYFAIGEHAAHSKATASANWEAWREMFGYNAYSVRSIKRWMGWYECLGEHREEASGLMSKAIDALCRDGYSQEARETSLRSLLEMELEEMSSEEAKQTALSYLTMTEQKEEEGRPEGAPREVVQLATEVAEVKMEIDGILSRISKVGRLLKRMMA